MIVGLRAVRDGDAQDLFGLLTLCFAEYPGCFLDPHDDVADLLRPAAAYDRPGAAFWVVEGERGRVCACIAVDWPEPGTAELHRLYVRPDRRGSGLGARLVALAETHAREGGARRMRLWSDTRFVAAHRLYGRLGYAASEEVRALGDVSASMERRFDKALAAAG